MLGSDLAGTCAAAGYQVQVYDLPEFDITDAAHVEQAVSGADVIVNCAAYTNVDGAERDTQIAHAVNGEAVGYLGTCAAKKRASGCSISVPISYLMALSTALMPRVMLRSRSAHTAGANWPGNNGWRPAAALIASSESSGPTVGTGRIS